MPKTFPSHCGFCGRPFADANLTPCICSGCGKATYRNPAPVAVLLLPVDGGVLCIRRGIPPNQGKLALPGGFVDWNETWQQAAARELLEETGIAINANQVADFYTCSAPPDEGVVLIFGVGPKLNSDDLPTFRPSDETTERVVVREPRELAFPLHTEAMREYFERRRRSRG